MKRRKNRNKFWHKKKVITRCRSTRDHFVRGAYLILNPGQSNHIFNHAAFQPPGVTTVAVLSYKKVLGSGTVWTVLETAEFSTPDGFTQGTPLPMWWSLGSMSIGDAINYYPSLMDVLTQLQVDHPLSAINGAYGVVCFDPLSYSSNASYSASEYAHYVFTTIAGNTFMQTISKVFDMASKVRSVTVQGDQEYAAQ